MKGLSAKRKILNASLVIIFLLAVQTLTYLTMGPGQLKDKLLTYPLNEIGKHSDSVFVRDFYRHIGDFYDGKIRESHHLNTDEDFIKSRLNVKYVYFDSEEKFDENDRTESKHKLIYQTFIERHPWTTLFGFYSIEQSEYLSVDSRYSNDSYISYRWFFFFWIPTYERIISNECPK